jgi:hypothetical protein
LSTTRQLPTGSASRLRTQRPPESRPTSSIRGGADRSHPARIPNTTKAEKTNLPRRPRPALAFIADPLAPRSGLGIRPENQVSGQSAAEPRGLVAFAGFDPAVASIQANSPCGAVICGRSTPIPKAMSLAKYREARNVTPRIAISREHRPRVIATQ